MTPRPRAAEALLEPPPLALVGCDFRVASAAWRSALVLSPEDRQSLRTRLAETAAARGVAVLDTCNRTEWLVETPHAAWAADLLQAWMVRRWVERFPNTPSPRPYAYTGAAAAHHFLRVAVGLESFVPGEREVSGQCSRALEMAREERAASPLLNALGHCAARTVRRVERLSAFRDAGRGIHGLAAAHVVKHLGVAAPREATPPCVGVAGMGAVGRRVASLLQEAGFRVTALNRTIPPEQAGRWRSLADLAEAVPQLDALIVATGAPSPTVDLDRLPLVEGRRPLLVLDLGIPSQVRPGRAGELTTLDGLKLDASLHVSESAQASAHDAVEDAVREFAVECAKRRSARLLGVVQRVRERTSDDRLPALLDEHAPELAAPRRRRLEAALRGLMREQHRALLDEIQRDATRTTDVRSRERTGPDDDAEPRQA